MKNLSKKISTMNDFESFSPKTPGNTKLNLGGNDMSTRQNKRTKIFVIVFVFLLALFGSIDVKGDNCKCKTTVTNTFLGNFAGHANMHEDRACTFIGYKAGCSYPNGAGNTFVGFEAGWSSSGMYNTFVGGEAGRQNYEGTYNTFLGWGAGRSSTDGLYNTFLGYKAGAGCKGESNIMIGCSAGEYTRISGDHNIFLGSHSGYSNRGDLNIFIGDSAGKSNLGEENIFIGHSAGINHTIGSNNIFLGQSAGFFNIRGSKNTFLGYEAGYKNTEGRENTFLGYGAGYENIQGDRNTFLGYGAGHKNTKGSVNTFVGYEAGKLNIEGSHNTFIGFHAGYKNQGEYNTFLGSGAGMDNSAGESNTLVGFQAGSSNREGSHNTFLGHRAGYKNQGEYNTFLGSGAGYALGEVSGTGNVFIGYMAGYNVIDSDKLIIDSHKYEPPYPYRSRVLIYGDFEYKQVGIAKTNPSYTLDVNGSARAQVFYESSDARLKSEVKPIKNALDRITSLRGVKFRWQDGKNDDGQHLGVIGQEIEKVFPEIVSTDNRGYKSVAYSNLVAPLIEAVKELKAENEALKARIEALEKTIKE